MRVESFDDFSAHFIAEFCCSDDDALNSYSIDVFCLSRISALRNDHLGVVWIFLHQLIRNLRIDINDSSRFVSSKVLYSCCREACYNDACINVAILQSIDCFAEGEVLYINIIVCDSISFQNLACIGFSTGAGCADCYFLAFQVGNCLNSLVLGCNELNCFRIESCKTAEGIHFIVFEHFLAICCVVSNIVLDESDINGSVFQHIDVSYGCAGGLCGSVHPFDVLVQDFS